MVNWGSLIFGGVDSSDYGIYITGEAVYNAPSRVVEFIDVPGRNGTIAMDQGRYENITVTYPCGMFRGTQEEFRRNLANFRNAILSQTGYQRLEDSYHPLDYRQAIYHDGLEVEPVMYGQAGEFELSFDCKPQRFLKSGEVAVPRETGDTIENPTLFDSKPLIEATGYGTISFNGYNIKLLDDLVGTVYPEGEVNTFLPYTSDISGIYVNANDTIQYLYTDPVFSFSVDVANGYSVTITNCVQSNLTYSGVTSPLAGVSQSGTGEWMWTCAFTGLNYNALTAKDAIISCTLTFTDSNNNTTAIDIEAKASYDGKGRIDYSLSGINLPAQYKLIEAPRISFDTLEIISTATTYGHPTYIDCGIGEAYSIKSGTLLSLNRYIDLGSDLPVLAPGINQFTLSNTITDFKITPRWWKI